MTRTTTRHTIVLESADLNGVTRLEKVCSEAITPGHLLAISSGAIIKHAAAAGVLPGKLFAVESLTPDTDTYPTYAAIDIPYASGDTVYYVQAKPGDVINAWLTTSMTATAGESYLVSTGDGTLTVASVGASTLEDSVVGVAENSVTTTSAVARIQVRIT